jgi:FixJ family two-component response regulator
MLLTPSSRIAPIVYVVDADVSVRESLELLFQRAGWQVEMFASARDFLARPRVLAPSCLVLDVSLPGLNGLDLQKRLVVDRADMPIIIVTGYGDVPMAVEAMKAGALEFLTKPLSPTALLEAVSRAFERSRTLLAEDAELRSLQARHAVLSRREREVMALITAGWLNKQVAIELGISEVTVKAHRGRVMRRMQAQSLAELVIMAARLRFARRASAEHGQGALHSRIDSLDLQLRSPMALQFRVEGSRQGSYAGDDALVGIPKPAGSEYCCPPAACISLAPSSLLSADV